ncbi:MAG: rhodanese-like domain-containing protein [Acidimicrobiales bacterium]
MTAPDAGRAPALEQQPRLRIVAGSQPLITGTPTGAGLDALTCDAWSSIGADAFVRAQLPLRFGRIDIDADVVDDEHSRAWWRFFVHTCAAHLLPGASMEFGAPPTVAADHVAPEHVVAGLVLIGELAAATGLEPIGDGTMFSWQRTLRRTVHDLVADARAGLDRVSPEALALLLGTDPTVVVLDTRTPTDREADGIIAGSLHAPRTVLEWAVDPASGYAEALAPDARLVVVCNEGYSSSLAARTLQDLGFADSTDLIGGMQAWIAAGLPVVAPTSHHGRCLLPEEARAVAALPAAPND